MVKIFENKISSSFRNFLKLARNRTSLLYRPKSAIFSINQEYTGEEQPKYCIRLYNNLVAICDTHQEAINTRNSLYNI